ncbi:TPA: fimbrial protein [Serratia marcescens]
MQYMTRHAKYARRPFLAWAASLMLHLSLVSAVHAATKVDVPVQALITPAPCTVQLTGLTGGVLDLGSQTSESLSAAGAVVGGKSFNVSLTQCGGDIGTTVPTITVSGETVGAAVTGGDFLFRDTASSTAENVGFIFHFGGTSVTWPDTDATTKKNLKNGSVINLTANTEGAVLPATWKTTPIPVGVAVSTGGSASGLVAGDLQAKVTFTFDYQ